jgi:hypothetical protein
MATTTAPVASTGPTQQAITDLKALRSRIEKMELALKRLQANRNPQSFQVSKLANAGPMAKVGDQQFMKYVKATGLYSPAYVDEMRNVYGSTFIQINESTGAITIQQGGCGPLIISAPEVQINTLVLFGFTTQFAQVATFNGGLGETTGHVTFSGLPTSSSGLSTGRVWRSGTTLMIV